jgi:hypothetical protein
MFVGLFFRRKLFSHFVSFQQQPCRGTTMYSSNIERLKKDFNEIKHYMNKLEKDGNTTLAYKIAKKYDYLNSCIHEIRDESEIA